MALNLQPSVIGGGDPNKVLFSSTNDIMNQFAGMPPAQANAPLTPPAPAATTAPSAPLAQTSTSLSSPSGYTNKYEQIFDEAQNKLESLLSQKQGIDPLGLAMSRGFFKPTKTGSFSESLGNVAEEVGNAQNEISKNEVSTLQARMALAKAASDRQREKDSEQLMSQLYTQGTSGLEMDPKVAMKLAGVLRDPKFLLQAQAEQKAKLLADAGSKVLQSTTTVDEEGKPKTSFTLNPVAFQEYARYTGDPLGAAEKYAKTIGEMRKNGMLSSSASSGTPFDALSLMADQLGKSGPALRAAAEQYAKQYRSGIMDEEKANTLAQHLLSMATSSMDRNAQMASNETFKNMSLALQSQSKAFMQNLAQQQHDLAEEKYKDVKDEKERKRQADLDVKEQAMQSMLDQVQKVEAHPGRYSGFSGYIDPRKIVPGTPAYDFTANLGVLKDKAFLTQVQQMRGLGSLSNTEGAKVAGALASLDPKVSQKEQQAQFDYITKVMQNSLSNIDRMRRGEKPVYIDPDKDSGTTPNGTTPARATPTTPAPTGAPKVKKYIPGKGIVEQ